MNRQSIDGVDAIIRSIRLFRSPTVDGAAIECFPMATRIENAEKERLEIARSYAREKLAEFVPAQAPSRERGYWDDMEIAYRPFYAFEEVLSAFGDATGATRAGDTMLVQMEAMARCVAGDDGLRMPEVLEVDRQQILAKYSLGKRVISLKKAPLQPSALDDRTFSEDGSPLDEGANDLEFLRGLLAKEQLWRKNNFVTALLLSRRELDLLTDNERKQFGRGMAYYTGQQRTRPKVFQKSGRSAVFDVVVTVIATIISAAIMYDALRSPSPSGLGSDKWLLAAISGGAGLLAWCVSAVLSSFAISLVGNPPYGARFAGTLSRLVTFQVSSEIEDYGSRGER